MQSQNFDFSKDVVLIIPCFNESETLISLLENISKTYLRDCEIFIVDDSPSHTSRRETEKWLSEKERSNMRIRFICEGYKTGRGNAVWRGMKSIFENQGAKYIVELDADGSHRIEDVVQVVNRIIDKSVVVASRYLPDSKIEGWSIRRKSFSKLLNFIIPWLFRLQVTDATNGLRGYSREAHELLSQYDFATNSFISLTESLLVLNRGGIQLKEVPCIFVERTSGKSTVDIRELRASLFGLIKLAIIWKIKT